MMQPEIVALGEPLIEFSAIDRGTLSEVKQFNRGFGGDASTFVVAVNRLGGKAGGNFAGV